MGEKLFEEWRVYEKLLIHDYMDHRAFFGRLQKEVTRQFQRPIRILDLGCGDLTPILPLLRAIPIKRYVGIDESDGALTLAAKNLRDINTSFELLNGNFMTLLPGLQEEFDLIVASFSLHHLADPADKLATLQAIAQHLADDGMFALIDVFCEEDEPRDEYLERWVAHADQRYRALQTEEKQLLFDHVRARDYPVSEKTWQTLGDEAGFGQINVLLQDQARLNGIVRFLV